MASEQEIYALIDRYGIYGALSIIIIKEIDQNKLTYSPLNLRNRWKILFEGLKNRPFETSGHWCPCRTLQGLIENEHIKFKPGVVITFKSTKPNKNYEYARVAIEILTERFHSNWPKDMKESILWIDVKKYLNITIGYSYQMHVLKALNEKDLILGLSKQH
jgi:hypothetical protein